MSAAEESTPAFNPVADDAAVAGRTDGSKPVDGALEAIKGEGLPTRGDLETFVVGISAAITSFHSGGVIAGGVPLFVFSAHST